MRQLFVAALFTCALGVPAALADDAQCTGFTWPMQHETTLFATPGDPIASGTTLQAAPETAIRVTLVPQGEAAYPLPQDRAPKKADAKGGWVNLPAPVTPGIYQLTLSTQAWIDVIQSGQRLPNAGFSSDPKCKTMRKSIRFDLKAEPVTLQLSDSAEGEVTLTLLPASSTQDAPPATAVTP